MPVIELIQDHWIGQLLDELEVADPSWERVKLAIDLLDAKTRTVVFMEGSDGSQMTIGGGDGKYVVSLYFSEDEGYTLIDKEADPSQELLLMAGGQVGSFPLNEIADYSYMLKAAQWYFEFLTSNPSLDWSRD